MKVKAPKGRDLLWLAATALLGACGSSSPAAPPPVDASSTDPLWCGRGTDVEGVVAPTGFCIKQYAQVAEARVITMAPNGDLFVAAPQTSTPGGVSGGPGAIIVLSDDNKDGLAEVHTFLANASDVHGLALGGGYLYFTERVSVYRTPYAEGQRMAVGAPESLNLPAVYGTGGRWTHGLARSPGGQLITSRGEFAMCTGTMPMGGEVSVVGADGALTTMASGFRNPMYLRCHRTDEVCAAMELGEDLAIGAHEKMIMLKPNTNYGFPCCYTKASPLTGPDMCATVDQEDAMFPLSDTPFGFDWEPGNWPAPFQGAVFVALHGSAYSSPEWQGAAIVYAATDPVTHAPTQDWQPFQGGFGPGGSILERPSDVAFSSDGRMFFSDDQGGRIYWIAPTTLPAPAN